MTCTYPLRLVDLPIISIFKKPFFFKVVFLSFLMNQIIESCDEPDHVSYARSVAMRGEEIFSCFQFVNHVLEKSAPHAHRELIKAQTTILERLPETHRTKDFIPYYYSLLPFSQLTYWSEVDLYHIQPGDLFTYIDKNYNPDPSSRAINSPSGTHVGIVDSVLRADPYNLRLRLLDSSKRIRGRCFYHCSKLVTPIKRGHVAYSLLSLLINPATRLWTVAFDGQKPLENKNVYALRIKPFTKKH